MLWSADPWGFHLVNVLLHGTMVVLIGLFVSRELDFENDEAIFTCLLFAAHPVHSEAVSRHLCF